MSDDIHKRNNIGVILCRVFIGSVFLLSGTNSFFEYLPSHISFYSFENILLKDFNYFFKIINFFEALCGTLLIVNLFAPLALIILLPLIIHIVIYTFIADTSFMIISVLLIFCCLVEIIHFWKTFYVFLLPQIYTHSWREEDANVLVLEEVEEKIPEKAEVVKSIIRQLKDKKSNI